MLDKEDLQQQLLDKKDKIRRLVAQLKKKPKEIKIFANLYGEYMVSTRGSKLLPKGQGESSVWHYDITLKIKDDGVSEKNWVSSITKKLLDAIQHNIENTFWYFGGVQK